MADLTSRMSWKIPPQSADPWYDQFLALMNQMDASAWAAREDRNLLLIGGGDISWNLASRTLTWTGDLSLFSPNTGFLLSIPTTSVQIEANEILYCTVTRAPISNVAVSAVIGAKVPSSVRGDDQILLAMHFGGQIVWRNGCVIGDGETITDFHVFGGGGGGFSAGGDLAGTPTNQTVVGLRGRPLSGTAPTTGQSLVWDGSQWAPAVAPGAFTAGLDLAGTPTEQEVVGVQSHLIDNEPTVDGTFLGVVEGEAVPFHHTGIAWDGSYFWLLDFVYCGSCMLYKVDPDDWTSPVESINLHDVYSFAVYGMWIKYHAGKLLIGFPTSGFFVVDTATSNVAVAVGLVRDAILSNDGLSVFIHAETYPQRGYAKVAVASIESGSPYALALPSDLPYLGGSRRMEIDRDTGTLFALTANYIVKVDPTSLAELSSYELPYSSRNFTMAFGSVWVTLDTDILVRAEIATFPADVVEIGSCNLDTGPIVASGGRIYIGSSDPEIRWVDPTDNSSDWDSALSSDAECPNAAVQGSLIWWPSTNRVFSTSGTSVVDTYAGFAGTSAVRWYDPFPSYGPGDEGKVLAIGEDGEKTWIEPVQPFNVVNINAQFGSGNPYYVDPDDGCIAVDTTVNPYGPLQDVYLALPPSPALGEYHEIVDWNGGSGSFGINVAGNGNLISGMWDYWIRVGWGSLRVRYTGTTWSVL